MSLEGSTITAISQKRLILSRWKPTVPMAMMPMKRALVLQKGPGLEGQPAEKPTLK
jgi:hypothetical protein